MSTFDVTSLRGRRADQRWNRTSVGDLLERLTWSRPDQTAIVGAPGAYFDPAFARVTYRQGDETANRAANALRAAGLEPADRVLL
jgi:non-ribosomal peptide synthetase component E (peptide arylation enzyme)